MPNQGRRPDNDHLSARVTALLDADLLILFSQIDGMYSADHRINPNAQHFPQLTGISRQIFRGATGPTNSANTGGGRSKAVVSRYLTSVHKKCVGITDGFENGALGNILDTPSKRSTLVTPNPALLPT